MQSRGGEAGETGSQVLIMEKGTLFEAMKRVWQQCGNSVQTAQKRKINGLHNSLCEDGKGLVQHLKFNVGGHTKGGEDPRGTISGSRGDFESVGGGDQKRGHKDKRSNWGIGAMWV